jgi:hypothetical protein
MSDDATPKPDFPSFITCRLNKDGAIQAFYVGPEYSSAVNWRTLDIKKRELLSKPEADAAASEPVKPLPIPDDGIREPGFGSTLDRFVKSIRSFYDLVEINFAVGSVFPGLFIERQFNEYRNKFLPIVETEGNYITHGIPEGHVSKINRKIKSYDHVKDGVASLPASVLMGLVARYDANISGLVRFLLQNRKEKLAGPDRTILIKDVLAASSFDELVASLIDDEIHSLMRGSHEDQVKYIEDNFSIKVRDGFKRWADFMEIFERRNLAAHGEGYVNARYTRICSAAKCEGKWLLNINDPVQLNNSYLRHSIDVLLEFGILITWWLWLKQLPSDAENAYSAISDVTYDLIVEKRYSLAAHILESVLSRKTEHAPETTRRMMAVNLANCQKKLDNKVGFDAALKLFDWTASADSYRISVASLREDIDTVCALMPRVADELVVGKSGFRDWPVFDWIRDDDRVKSKFKEVFGEPIELANNSEQPQISQNDEKGGLDSD